MSNTSFLGNAFWVIHYCAQGMHTFHTHCHIELIILHREHNTLTLHQVCAGSNLHLYFCILYILLCNYLAMEATGDDIIHCNWIFYINPLFLDDVFTWHETVCVYFRMMCLDIMAENLC